LPIAVELGLTGGLNAPAFKQMGFYYGKLPFRELPANKENDKIIVSVRGGRALLSRCL
jgi:hypothetical protein